MPSAGAPRRAPPAPAPKRARAALYDDLDVNAPAAALVAPGQQAGKDRGAAEAARARAVARARARLAAAAAKPSRPAGRAPASRTSAPARPPVSRPVAGRRTPVGQSDDDDDDDDGFIVGDDAGGDWRSMLKQVTGYRPEDPRYAAADREADRMVVTSFRALAAEERASANVGADEDRAAQAELRARAAAKAARKAAKRHKG